MSKTNQAYSKGFDDGSFMGLLTGFAVTVVLIGILLMFSGAIDRPLEKLDLSSEEIDKLAEEYVVSYYPEYENHTFDFTRHMGQELVRVYEPPKLDDRDGLSINYHEREDNLVEEIYFKNITLNEIARNKLLEGLE